MPPCWSGFCPAASRTAAATAPGPKHGPFFYLNRCFPKGRMQTLLLKSPEQIDQARHSLAAYAQIQERLDELSQINYELLRRGENWQTGL